MIITSKRLCKSLLSALADEELLKTLNFTINAPPTHFFTYYLNVLSISFLSQDRFNGFRNILTSSSSLIKSYPDYQKNLSIDIT